MTTSQKMYDMWTWYTDGHKVYIGRHTEEFAREYCKQFAGKDNFHVSALEVKKDKN